MHRFVLRYKGDGAKPPGHVDKIRALPDTRVVDDTAPRMTVVETEIPHEELSSRLGELGLGDWAVRADNTIPLPDTNFQPKKSP